MSKNVAVFVDVANIFYAAKAAGVDIDYVTLLKAASAGRDLVRAYAYTGLDPENENQRNFHAFLARNGYRVVSKDIRKYGDGKVKANLDIELVIDMMKTARNLDVAIVVSGDGDFAPAIRAVQEMGVRVEVVSFRGNTSSDLIDVADQFTDIIHLARVEKGSSRSGRRVAEDDQDLSMTEVPDKQTEGSGGRGRSRGRERTRSREAAGSGRARGSAGRGRAAASGRGERAPEEPAVALTSSGAPLVVLPGEKLSRAAGGVAGPAAIGDSGDVDEDAAETLAGPAGDERLGQADGDHRRRRRRGGRGRGRGRGRGEGGDLREPRDVLPRLGEAGEAGEAGGAEEVLDEPYVAPGRRPTPFGSVWDSQLGVPSPALSGAPLGPAPLGPESEDDFAEPEIPEYLIAERRNRASAGRGGRGGPRGRGGRGGYAAAVERERYGGGRGGGINRYPDVSGRERPPREPGFARPGSPRPPVRAPGGSPDRPPRGGDPWSEVPPEVEAMLRAQLTPRPRPESGGTPPPAPDGAAEVASPRAEESAAKPRRTTRRMKAVAADDGDTAIEAAPKRRTTRKAAASGETKAKTPIRRASAKASSDSAATKRRTTRRTAETESSADTSGEG